MFSGVAATASSVMKRSKSWIHRPSAASLVLGANGDPVLPSVLVLSLKDFPPTSS